MNTAALEPGPIQKWKRLSPIIIFQLYLNLTVFIFAFGPWPWPVPNKWHFYLFLAASHLALLLGYLSKCFSEPPGYKGKMDATSLLRISMVLNLILVIPTLMVSSGGHLDLGAALADPGIAYQAKIDMADGSGSMLNYVRFVLGPWLWPLLPLFVLYHKRLNKALKFMCALSIASGLAVWILMGTNKGVFDFVIISTSFILIKWIKDNDPALRRKVITLAVGFVLMFSLAGLMFIKSTTSRMRVDESPRYFPYADMYSDDNSILVKYLPPGGQSFVRGFSIYLSLGYYGLGQALEKPFQSCYGVGHSLFLQLSEKRITGHEYLTQNSLMDRLERENGYSKLVFWHSIYTWIASDVGFCGTIFIIFLIGRMLAMSWLDVLAGLNPFAVPVFASYLICIFYFSANNQAVAFPESFSAFYVTHFMWLRSRGHKDLGKS